MKGVIKHINALRGMVAVLTEERSYSVFELLGGESVEIGDVVSWKNDCAAEPAAAAVAVPVTGTQREEWGKGFNGAL